MSRYIPAILALVIVGSLMVWTTTGRRDTGGATAGGGGGQDSGVRLAPVDFGVQAERTGTIDRVLRVRNDGPADARVVQVRVGCSCLSAVLPNPVLVAAGGSAEVPIRLDRERMINGVAKNSLLVKLDDGRQLVSLATYEYAPRIDANPGNMVLASDGQPASLEITLADAGDAVASVESSSGQVRVEPAEARRVAGRARSYAYAVSGSDPTGDGVETDLVVTLEDGTHMLVPARVLPTLGVRARPQLLMFSPNGRASPGDDALVRRLFIRHPDGASVARVDVSSECFETKVTAASGTESVVEVRLLPDAFARLHGGKLLEGVVKVYLDAADPAYASVDVLVAP